MSLCDFFPDDESCKTDPIVDPDNGGNGPDVDPEPCEGDDCAVCEGDDCEIIDEVVEMLEETPFERMMKIDALMRWTSRSNLMPQIVFTLVSAVMTTNAGFYLWRTSTVTNYYTAYATTGSMYKTGQTVAKYGQLAIFGVAFITSLLAMFGIMPWLNVMVWSWGVGIGFGIVELVAFILEWFQYGDELTVAKTLLEANDKLAAPLVLSAPFAIVNNLRSSFLFDLGTSAAFHLALFWELEAWAAAMFDAQSDEEKEAQFAAVYEGIEALEKEWAGAIVAEEEMMEGEEDEEMEEGEEMEGDAAEEGADEADA